MSANLAAALVAAQQDMPAVEPDATNPHYKTKFTSLHHLIAKTRPVLNKHGLALIQLPATNELGAPVLRTIVMHGPSGEQVSADAPLMLGKNDMQGLGSAITYARRYAWSAALGISSDEDDDGNSARVSGDEPSRPRSRAGAQAAHPSVDPVEAAAPASSPVNEKQAKKLNVLVGQLRGGGHITTEQLYSGLGRDPQVGDDGELHWAPLRDSLTFAEASALIERLSKLEKRVAESQFQAPPGAAA